MFQPRSFVIAVMLAVWAVPASAQSQSQARPERPYRGLFGSGTPEEPGHKLVASAMLLSGYDDNLRAEARSGGGTPGGTGGTGGGAGGRGEALRGGVSTAMGSMTYTFTGTSLKVSMMGGGVGRFYPSLDTKFIRYSHAAGTLAYNSPAWKRFSLSLSTSAAYRPYFFDSSFLFPSNADLPDPSIGDVDLPYVTSSYISHNEQIGLTHQLTRRTNLRASYAYRGAEKGSADRAFSRQSSGVMLNHNLSQGLGLHAGYTLRETRYSSDRVVPLHIIDVGANYSRALSFSRRTTLSFGTGTSAIDRDDGLRFRATGHVQLTHEIGRTWTADAAYNRSVLANEVWDEPSEADGITVGVTGLVTRRLQLNVAGRGVLGKTGFADDAPGFDGAYGAATLAYALNRFTNITAVYAYYQHKFDRETTLRIGLPTTVGRQSVRVGVMLWAPVFQRTRRADASR